MKDQLELMKASARIIELQALENRGLAIAVDPDLAEFMGAFSDDAIDPADFDQEGD